jgi:hypothetical protein
MAWEGMFIEETRNVQTKTCSFTCMNEDGRRMSAAAASGRLNSLGIMRCDDIRHFPHPKTLGSQKVSSDSQTRNIQSGRRWRRRRRRNRGKEDALPPRRVRFWTCPSVARTSTDNRDYSLDFFGRYTHIYYCRYPLVSKYYRYCGDTCATIATRVAQLCC